MSEGRTIVEWAALKRFPGDDVDAIRLRIAFEIGAQWMLNRALERAGGVDPTVRFDGLRDLFGPAPGGRFR